MGTDKVNPKLLYNLRSLLLSAEQAQVALHQAQVKAAQCQLDIEKDYGLLGTNATLEIATGVIKRGDDEQEIQAEKGQQEKEEPAA